MKQSKSKNKNDIPKSFIIYFARRKTKHVGKNIWRQRSVTFSNDESRIICLWVNVINDILKQQNRPKKILLFVNPFGGKKKAMAIFEKYGKPLFELGNIDINVIVSQRQNQIHDFILSQSLNGYDGIVCVGGDGTFSEVINGLIQKTMKDQGKMFFKFFIMQLDNRTVHVCIFSKHILEIDIEAPEYIPKPKIPIGVIPGGSTDTVAYCLHGTTDIQTSVIHIVLGQKDGLDLCSIKNGENLLRFYASVMSYGFLGDVALDSERYRWMGPSRYNYSGYILYCILIF